MGYAGLVDVLDFHMKKEVMWRNRNCILKIALNKEKSTNIHLKYLPMTLYREILKYA